MGSNLLSLPTQYSTATIGDIANRVAIKKLNRADKIQDAAFYAADAYLSLTSKIPFEALELTSTELPVVQGTDTYDLNAQNIGTVYRLHSVRISYTPQPNGNSFRLRRNDVRSYDTISFQIQGRPYEYARWGSTLQFYPIPDNSTYTYRVRFYQQPNIVTDQGGIPSPTQIVLPAEWLELIYYETLYRMYIDLDEFDKARFLMETSQLPNYPQQPKRSIIREPGIIPRLYNDLLETIKMRERGDEDFSVNPIYRAYSAMGSGR